MTTLSLELNIIKPTIFQRCNQINGIWRRYMGKAVETHKQVKEIEMVYDPPKLRSCCLS